MRTLPSDVHAAIHKIAICHIVFAVSVLGLALHHPLVTGFCWLVVGIGGLGAAWSLWTFQDGGWLDISGAKWPPSRAVAQCALEHGPFACMGLWLVLR